MRPPESWLDTPERSMGMPPGAFDVFLSHNSEDKPTVVSITEGLRERGVNVWLDLWELVPGRPWQEALEEVLLALRRHRPGRTRSSEVPLLVSTRLPELARDSSWLLSW